MLFSRAVPGPGPNISSKISSLTALPEVPRFSCMGGTLGRLRSTLLQNNPTADSPTCLQMTPAALSSNPLLQAGVHLPRRSSSRRPATRPGLLMASARRAVTAEMDDLQVCWLACLTPTRLFVLYPGKLEPAPGCSVRQTTPTSSLWPLQSIGSGMEVRPSMHPAQLARHIELFGPLRCACPCKSSPAPLLYAN